MRTYQRTLSGWIQFSGTGLHTGVPSFARILPADIDTGILFRRTDTGEEVRATADNVTGTAHATTLGSGRSKVSTVEHFLAALYGMGIDNAIVEVNGPELPILDGSARPVAEAIDFVGTEESDAPLRVLRITGRRRIDRNGSSIEVSPSDRLEILLTIDFPGTLIGKQSLDVAPAPETFLKDIAPARTFVLREQVEILKASGLAKGGAPENAIEVEGDRILGEEELRFPDEFARHKLLDFLGDLGLLGRPVLGRFHAYRPGHDVNLRLVDCLSGIADSCARAGADRPEPPEMRITA